MEGAFRDIITRDGTQSLSFFLQEGWQPKEVFYVALGSQIRWKFQGGLNIWGTEHIYGGAFLQVNVRLSTFALDGSELSDNERAPLLVEEHGQREGTSGNTMELLFRCKEPLDGVRDGRLHEVTATMRNQQHSTLLDPQATVARLRVACAPIADVRVFWSQRENQLDEG